jgi:hypothetical protein
MSITKGTVTKLSCNGSFCVFECYLLTEAVQLVDILDYGVYPRRLVDAWVRRTR